MAQQKELKSAFGQGPSGLSKAKDQAANQLQDEFFEPLDASDYDGADIIPPDTAIPNTPRGLPEQQPDQGIAAQQGGFVGPYSPEFYQGLQATQRPDAFTIPPAYREMYGMSDIPVSPQETGLDLPPEEREKRLNDLIDRGELGTSIALGVAFPGMGLLGISTTAGALNYVKNTLKNQLVPDATKKDEVEKLFNATVTSALTGGIGLGLKAGGKLVSLGVEKALQTETGQAIAEKVVNTKAVRWFLDKLIQDSSKSGDKTIANQARNMYDSLGAEGEATYEKMLLQKAAEADAAKKAGVELTAGEQYFFDDEATKVTQDALNSNPGIGMAFAQRLGKYTKAIKGLFGAEGKAPSGGIKEYIDNQISTHHEEIGKINQQLMASGVSLPEVRLTGQELLSTLDESIAKYGKNMESDVLQAKMGQILTIRNRLANQLSAGGAKNSLGDKGVQLLDQYGKPIAKPPAELGLGDIQTVLGDLRSLVKKAYDADKKKTAVAEPASYDIAKDIYGKMAQVRDNLSEQIATKIGRPELAQRVSGLRQNYSQNIDKWRAVENELSSAPSNEIKYLFSKEDPAFAEQVMSVLPEPMKQQVRRDFVGRFLDPVYLAETGETAAVKALEATKNGLSGFQVARKMFGDYDPKVLMQIYGSQQTVNAVKTFLDLGARAESFLAKRTLPAEKAAEKAVGTMQRLIANPSASGAVGAMREIISLLPNNSPLRNRLAAPEYIASQRAAGKVSAETARKLGAPEAGAQEIIGKAQRSLSEKIKPAETGAAGAAGSTFSQMLGM